MFSGRGTFWTKDPSTKATFEPRQLLFYERGTVHAMPELFDHPVVFLSIDTPRREPTDIIFVDPKDGSPETFMARNGDDINGSREQGRCIDRPADQHWIWAS